MLLSLDLILARFSHQGIPNPCCYFVHGLHLLGLPMVMINVEEDGSCQNDCFIYMLQIIYERFACCWVTRSLWHYFISSCIISELHVHRPSNGTCKRLLLIWKFSYEDFMCYSCHLHEGREWIFLVLPRSGDTCIEKLLTESQSTRYSCHIIHYSSPKFQPTDDLLNCCFN